MNREHLWQSGLLPDHVLHGSTTKTFGVFRSGRASEAEVQASRGRFAEAVGVPQEQYALVHQVHGSDVLTVDDSLPRKQWQDGVQADAMVTRMPGVLLIIKTADCIPVFFYDPQHDAVGIAHAGWKGVAADVVGETIERMKGLYGTNASQLLVSIGPGICAQHYDVTDAKDDRIKQYEQRFGKESPVIVRKQGRVAFDLPAACKQLCLNHGVKAGNIELSGVCTYEKPELWASFRREGEALKHDIWSFIGIKS